MLVWQHLIQIYAVLGVLENSYRSNLVSLLSSLLCKSDSGVYSIYVKLPSHLSNECISERAFTYIALAVSILNVHHNFLGKLI